MWIKTDSKSNQKSLIKLKFTAFIVLFFLVLFSIIMLSCNPKGLVEVKVNEPPILYNATLNTPIPNHQQWLVPYGNFISNKVQVNEEAVQPDQTFGEKAWLSPPVELNYPTGQFYVYIDYAGKQDTRLDSEYYILPICQTKTYQSICLPLEQKSEHDYHLASTKENTDYQKIKGNKSWFYYSHHNLGRYLINPQESLTILVNAKIPTGYQPSWVRITMSEHPITPTKMSFLLTQQYIKWFKFLLLLLPLIVIYSFYINDGYSNRSAISIGLGIAVWMTINVVIWDINYMVLGCLCIAFAGVLYMSGYWLYLVLYLLGYLTIVQGAFEEFGSFNKDFFMKVGLLTVIGVLLLLRGRSE